MTDNEVRALIEKTINEKGHININSEIKEIDEIERDRIVSLIVGEGKFMLDRVPNTQQWILRKNPSYELGENIRITNNTTRRVIIFSAAISVLTLLTQGVETCSTLAKYKHEREQESQIEQDTSKKNSATHYSR